MGKLDNKVAIVTGGSRGIGAASALALADEGADVAISYSSSADRAKAVVPSWRRRGCARRPSKPTRRTRHRRRA